MKALYLAVVISVVLPVWGAHPAWGQSTQLDLNNDAIRQLKTAEGQMTDLLAKLHEAGKGNAKSIKSLDTAQEAWRQYRDAQLVALWPSSDTSTYGSAHPMCVTLAKARLTEIRIAELKTMLLPEEADVCGSRWPD